MPKINILDSTIYNKIAAGEVVERPASALKELLDNSIDAGSDDIKIEIKGGGLKSIVVKDNGCGISKEDIKLAFLPHATSKIKDENDLYGIKTLGFRGEALASVCSVSMVEIISATDEGVEGVSLKLSGGTVVEEKACTASKGTAICIENLFFNTPARLKFLKTERSEESEIVNITARYILSNPNIRIKLTCNEKLIYQSYGLGLKDAINCIYGKDVLSNITEINAEKNGFKINGYIGLPSFSKANRTYQTVVLNGRYIINKTISIAVLNAYRDFLLKRQYPFYILHLTIPENFVDVNVHPNKADVRFEDNNKIFSLVYNPIFGSLHSTMQSIVLQINDKFNNETDIKTECNVNTDLNPYTERIINRYDRQNMSNPQALEVKDIYNSANSVNICKNGQEKLDKNDFLKYNIDIKNPLNDDFKLENNNIDNQSENNSININCNIQTDFNDAINKKNQNFDYEIKCVLFDTYIVLELKDNILFIDQHAGHERILYDKLCENYNKHLNAVQLLMIPFLLNVNSNEFDLIFNNLDILKDLGFNIEIFGDSVFKISSVPMLLSGINLNKFFIDVLGDLNNLRQRKTTEYIKEELMKKACHCAVKAGEKLEKFEIDCILTQLFDNKVLLCPHGRPIVIKYSKLDFEKLFKRVL